jgi:hypothetical protein
MSIHGIEGASLVQEPEIKLLIATIPYFWTKEFDNSDPVNPAAPVTKIFSLFKTSFLGRENTTKLNSIKID